MSNEEKLVIFELNQQQFAMPIINIKEIVRLLKIVNIPFAPSHVKGIFNFRGQIIPLISLNDCLGLPQKEADQESRIMVIEFSGKMAGLLVDSVMEVTRYNLSEIESPDGIGNNHECISGFIQRDANILQVINLEKLLEQIKL